VPSYIGDGIDFGDIAYFYRAGDFVEFYESFENPLRRWHGTVRRTLMPELRLSIVVTAAQLYAITPWVKRAYGTKLHIAMLASTPANPTRELFASPNISAFAMP
jgi:hypothetical protein